MKSEKRVANLLLVDTRPLKKILSESLPGPMGVMKQRLLDIAAERSAELTQKYSQALHLLTFKSGMTLAKHADLVENYNIHRQQQESLEETYGILQRAFMLLTQYQVKVPIDLMTQRDTVEEQKELSNTAMDTAKRHIDAENLAYASKLDDAQIQLDQHCEETLAELAKSPFTDAKTTTAEALEQLAAVEARVANFREEAAANDRMTQLMRGLDPEQKVLKGLEDALTGRTELWKLRRAWEEVYASWLTADFRVLLDAETNGTGFNGEELEKVIEDFFSKGRARLRAMKGDPVAEDYVATVKQVRAWGEGIMQLGHPSLQDRHWAEISDMLGIGPSLYKNTVTLQKLLDLDAFNPKFAEKLDIVCGGAGKEYKLKKMNEKMQAAWEKVEWNFSQYKDTDTYKLSSLDEIQQLLDDQIVNAQTMKGSPFAKPFLEDGDHMGGVRGIGRQLPGRGA